MAWDVERHRIGRHRVADRALARRRADRRRRLGAKTKGPTKLVPDLATAVPTPTDGGNDTIITGAGCDTAYGGDGNDQIHGGGGADSIDGGAGDDTIFATRDGKVEFLSSGERRVVAVSSTE